MSIEDAPLILPFAGVTPAFAGAPRACGARSSILGRVGAGRGLLLGAFATIRADGEQVTLGDEVAIGEGATIHIAQDRHAAVLGHRVAVGRNAVVHACTIADDVVIEDDVVILDGSEVGAGAVIEPGATVYPRSRLAAGGRYAGSPAVLVGPADEENRARRAGAVRAAAEASARALPAARGRAPAPVRAAFVARTAVLSGPAVFAPGASLFFGCRLATAALTVGADTNIQDNCVFDTPGEVVIGRDTTLGHNVRMGRGHIGDRSLVGIGTVLAEDTTVESDVLVAAGTETLPGQILETGWLWGSRPAKPLKRLDEARRTMMAETVRHYLDYAHAFAAAQDAAGGRPAGPR